MSSDARFDKIIGFTLEHEVVKNSRGEVIAEHDPADPGGTTKFGIDKASHPRVDVENLTEEDAKKIYFDENWVGTGASSLPLGFGEIVFDMSVLDGTGRAIRVLQKAVGVDVDGGLGKQTRDGVDAVNSDDTKRRTALDRMIDLREQRYHDLADSNPKLGRFLKGWLNRSEDLRKFLDIAHV